MANQQTSDNYSGKLPDYSGKLPDSVPFLNFVGLIQQNSKLSTTLQALGKEWTEFVQARLREDTRLLQTLGECKELPSMQRAYTHFWEKALSQYEEETQRLMRITQGAMEEAAHIAQQRIEVTSGNAYGSAASSSSTPPSPMKRVSPSDRGRA